MTVAQRVKEVAPSLSQKKSAQAAKFISELRCSFAMDMNEQNKVYKDLLKCFHESQGSAITMIKTNCKIPEQLPLFDKNGETPVLCLDVGGSTIRTAVLYVRSDGVTRVERQEEWLLKEEDKVIDFQFFDLLVKKMCSIICDDEKERLWKVGVTWSFPLNAQNEILNMGKGFESSNEIEGFSLLQLIRDAFNRLNSIKVENVSIINDSVAVNLASYLDPKQRSSISLIIGTGLNSCIELKNELINTELGFFGKLDKPTLYDLKIDSRWGNNDGTAHLLQDDNLRLFQPLEFICASRYICELFRLIFLHLIEVGIISVTPTVPAFLETPYGIHGSFITLLEDINDITSIKSALRNEFELDLSKLEIIVLHDIVDIVLERSSIYVALGIRSLHHFINGLNDDHDHDHDGNQNEPVVVNFIGSFLVHSELYQEKIIKHSKNGSLRLNHVTNSSIVGAAVAAFLGL